MQPVTILTLLVYVPAFLLMLALYGNPFRVLFEKYLTERNITLDGVERVGLTLASGSALIPLIVMLFTMVGGLLIPFTVKILTSIFIVLNLVIYRNKIGRANPKFVLPDTRTKIVLLTFLTILTFNLIPVLGLFVHPGNDPALYSLISLRIVESKGYTSSWGSFASSAWYQEKVHLIMAGFAGTCAYFHLLTALAIEKAVLIITMIYVSLISFGVYFLVKRLFKNRDFALCSAFAFGMLIQEPGIGWFTWGGNAELSSLFLLPVVIGIFWETFSRDDINLGYSLYLAFLVAGMVLYHSLAAFYLAFFLIAYIVIYIRKALSSILKILIVAFLSIVFILPIFTSAVISEMAIAEEYAEAPNPFWTPTLQWQPMIRWYQSATQNVYNVMWRLLAVYGAGAFLLMIAVKVLQDQRYDKKIAFLLLAWWIVIFFFHENNPCGLYLIRFPLWYRIAGETNRVFTETSFPVSIVIGVGMSKVFENIREIRFLKGSVFSKLKSMLKILSRKKLMPIVMFLCILQVSINVDILLYARGNSPVTEDDISAFNWIKQNTSLNDVFFVMHNDAGFWIPVYTNRRVVIPFGVVTNSTLISGYYNETKKSSIEDLSSYEVLNLLNDQNVSYVYVGSKKILKDLFPLGFNSSFLLQSPLFKLVYNQTNVIIFKYLGATFNTIWADEDFLSGWTIEQGTGDTVNGVYRLKPPVKTAPWPPDQEPRCVTSHELQLDNAQNITYLEIRWQTTNKTTLFIQIEISGLAKDIQLGKSSFGKWKTSTININSFGTGKVNRISICVEGEGYGYVDSIVFKQAIPIKRSE